MGCFETITVTCAWCGDLAESQTKALGDHDLSTWEEGDRITNSVYTNCIFQLKSPCKCGGPINLLIQDQVITRTTKDTPDFVEGYGGEVE